MGWYLAASLVQLRAEVNQRWPKRDKTSDGALGDQAHAARASDHNPDGKGCVHAIDIDKDGIDVAELLDALIGDPRVQYVIWNRRIANRDIGPWTWRPYTGPNPHDKHVHVSIRHTAAAENDTSTWLAQEENDMTPEQLTNAVAAGVLAALKAPVVPVTRGGKPAAKSVLTLLSNFDGASKEWTAEARDVDVTPADIAAVRAAVDKLRADLDAG